jgi:2'-5' RNA ligase
MSTRERDPAQGDMGGEEVPQPKPRMRRLFIAVPLSEDVRARVARLVEGVQQRDGVPPADDGRRSKPGVRWVRMDGLHVTLRFLGPIPEDRLTSLERTVHDVARRAAPFDVALGGAGGFPSAARPRALWLGITTGGEQLQALTHELNEALVIDGWPPDERPFRAHLTLARADGVRSGPAAARRLVQAAQGFAPTWRADRLILFESHTGGGPARYEPLVEARFEGLLATATPPSG